MLSILNSVSSLNAENALSSTQANLQKTLTQLSTGLRINSGADDAAGLSIANGLAGNIAALNQSVSNVSDGVGALQTADGALSQVTTLLNRAVTLATELAKIHDPFLKESLMLAIDGVSASDLRKMMELHLDYRGEKDERIPKVFEAAAGFAPTIGILGAVLGLIQVMQRLQDINEVGKGIAVAFVATALLCIARPVLQRSGRLYPMSDEPFGNKAKNH